MTKLSPQTFADARSYIFTHGSQLTCQRFLHAFAAPNPSGVLSALAAYQNPDGGFGHNLEGDFALPASSPMATSVAFQVLTDLGATESEPLVQGGIAYLVESYRAERPGWMSVPPAVNDYAHASWWHFRPELGCTVIDFAWGNPSAELTGYLARYRRLVPAGLLDPLLAHTLDYFQNFSGAMDMHQLYCFLRFAGQLPSQEAQALQPKLTELVKGEVCTDPAAWSGYCAQPLDFVSSPASFLYPHLVSAVEANLDYRIDAITPHGVSPVPWNWEDYPAEWQAHQPEIAARSTLQTLILLKRFGRLAN